MIPPLPSLTTNLAYYLTMKTQINQDSEVKIIKQTLVQVNQKKPKRSKQLHLSLHLIRSISSSVTKGILK